MSVKVEKLENNMAKLTIEVDKDIFEKAVEDAYRKNRGKIQIPGFRKGKVPRKLIEKTYGEGVFYEDAANAIMPEAYENAAKESGLEITSRPEIDVSQIGSGQNFIFTASVAIKPEIELGQYKGIEVYSPEIDVTEEEINAELNKVREQNSRIITVEDRPAKNGDIVNIDFEGFIDGEAFQGGRAEGHEITLGSKSFIDTFEEQIEGKNIDEEFDVKVNFPEEYGEPSLAGKPAVFKVKLNEIKEKELPEIDDDLAMDVSEFDTLDEYKEEIAKDIRLKKEEEAQIAMENSILEKVIENSKVEIPEPMTETEVDNMLHDMSHRLRHQGISFEQYMQFTGDSLENMKARLKPEAERRIKIMLALEAIAAKEDFPVSDEEMEEEWERRAKSINMSLEDLKKEINIEEENKELKKALQRKKAIEMLRETAIKTDKKPEEEKVDTGQED